MATFIHKITRNRLIREVIMETENNWVDGISEEKQNSKGSLTKLNVLTMWKQKEKLRSSFSNKMKE